MSIANQITRIQNEITTQEDLIAQIVSALENKAAPELPEITFKYFAPDNKYYTFTAKMGMTWREFIDSEYNTNSNFTVYSNGKLVCDISGLQYIIASNYDSSTAKSYYPALDDYIWANYNYYRVFVNTGGSN